MDALNFAGAGIGTSINVNTPIKLINGVPARQAYYNSSFAQTFHNYKVLWVRCCEPCTASALLARL